MTDYTQLPRNQKVLTLVGTLLGMLLAALDQTIVATAGPAIQKDLHIDPSLYVWLTTSYLVASTVMTPVWGKLSDIYGRRRVLVIGISIFLLGSLACGVSQGTTQLIAARIVQGIGAASLFTTAFAVVADLFTPRERGKYAGIFGAVFGLSSVVGPLLGGFITDNFGWHWCFFINLPIGAVALAVIITRMPALLQDHDHKPTIDFGGAALFAVAIIPLLLALSLGKTEVAPGQTALLWTSPAMVGMLAAFVIGSVAFIAWEKRARDPMIDLSLFSNRAFAIGNVASFTVGMAFLGAIVFLPLFMVNVVGLSATQSGLTTTPLTFGLVFGNIFSGQVSSRTGKYKFLILGSLVILTTGFAIMAFTVHSDATQAGMTLRMILIGLGLGPSIPLFNLHIANSVEPHQIGAATSTATLSRSLGSTMGLAIFGTVFGTTLSHAMTDRMAEATKGLPPQLAAQFQPQTSTSTSTEEGAPAPTGFDAAAIEQKIHDSFNAQRAAIEVAFSKDGFGLDLGRDEAFTSLAAALTAITEQHERKRRSAYAALDAGPEALAALAADPSTPPMLANALLHGSGGVSTCGSPLACKGPAIDLALAAGRAEAISAVRAKAIAQAKAGLDAAEVTAVDTVHKIAQSVKESFTDAITRVYGVGIFFALLGLLVSLTIPELPLRGGSRPQTPSE